jgi:hypothetical protein
MRIYNGLPPPKVQRRAGRVQRKMAAERTVAEIFTEI